MDELLHTELFQNYKFLRDNVPRSSNDMMNKCNKDIELLRDEVIKAHRTIIQIDVFFTHLDCGESIPSKSELPSFILNPTEVFPPRVSPQLLQQAAHLFGHIHMNVNDLVAGLLTFEGTPDFNYLIQFCIPAIYGYFSCQEHILMAFEFYALAIDKAKPETGIKILTPFFSAPCLFRFYEAVIFPFLNRILHDSRIKTKQKRKTDLELVKIYANYLLEYINASANLMPSLHLLAMRFILQRWGIDNFIHFFFNTMLRKYLNAFIEIRQKKDQIISDYLDKIIKYLTSTPKVCQKMAYDMINTSSILETPYLYSIYGTKFLYFYTCISEVLMITKMLNRVKPLPPSMNTYSLEKTPKYSIFLLRVFPKHGQIKIPQYIPLFFNDEHVSETKNDDYCRYWNQIQNHAESQDEECFDYICSPKFSSIASTLSYEFLLFALQKSINSLNANAKNFENLLLMKMNVHQMETWRSDVHEMLRFVVQPIAVLATLQARKRNYSTIDFAFSKASKLFHSTATRQDQYLMLVELYENDIFESIRKDINQMTEDWIELMKNQKKNLNVDSIILSNYTANRFFFECVAKFSTIENAHYPSAFRALMESFQMIEQLTKIIKSSFPMAAYMIEMSECKSLIKFYYVINTLAMQSEVFKALCSDKESLYWVKFEGILMKSVVKSESLSMKLINMTGKATHIPTGLLSLESVSSSDLFE